MVPIALALLIFAWEYSEPRPTFVLSLESLEGITGTQRLLVRGVTPRQCASIPDATNETYCMSMRCPGPGSYRAIVTAQQKDTDPSDPIEFRIRDNACIRIEGAAVVVGGRNLTGIPAGQKCRAEVTPPPQPDVTMEIPSQVEVPRTVATPRTEAPVIPANPNVVAKVPLEPGTAPAPPPSQRAIVPRAVNDPPPTRTVTVPAGPPTTVPVTLPPVSVPGVDCPY